MNMSLVLVIIKREYFETHTKQCFVFYLFLSLLILDICCFHFFWFGLAKNKTALLVLGTKTTSSCHTALYFKIQ